MPALDVPCKLSSIALPGSLYPVSKRAPYYSRSTAHPAAPIGSDGSIQCTYTNQLPVCATLARPPSHMTLDEHPLHAQSPGTGALATPTPTPQTHARLALQVRYPQCLPPHPHLLATHKQAQPEYYMYTSLHRAAPPLPTVSQRQKARAARGPRVAAARRARSGGANHAAAVACLGVSCAHSSPATGSCQLPARAGGQKDRALCVCVRPLATGWPDGEEDLPGAGAPLTSAGPPRARAWSPQRGTS